MKICHQNISFCYYRVHGLIPHRQVCEKRLIFFSNEPNAIGCMLVLANNITQITALHQNGENWTQLDYQRHILLHIDWSAIEDPDPNASAPASVRRQVRTVDLDDRSPTLHVDQELQIDKTIRISHFARHLSDIVPNPWQAARIAKQLIDRLRQAGDSEEQIYDRRAYLSQVLQEHVKAEMEMQAEGVFRNKLNEGEIRFDLETGGTELSGDGTL